MRSSECLIGVLGVTLLAMTPAGAQSVPWNGTWGAAPALVPLQDAGSLTLSQQTLRQIVHTSIGGSTARIHLSNAYGTAPLVVSDVHLGLSTNNMGTVTQAGTEVPVTFQGASTVTIPAGASVISDSVNFTVPALSDVAVSLYFPSTSAPTAVTGHDFSPEYNFWASGDLSGMTSFSSSNLMQYLILTNLDVQQPQASGTVVAFGASITDGYNSTNFANHRWPDFLAQRLAASGRTVGVVDSGIAGDALLTNGGMYGDSGLSRFNRDAVTEPGVKWVIVSDLPINDLGGNPNYPASQIISGLQTLMSQAHAAGLKYLCSTLTPYEHSARWSATGEATREQVNDFLRSSSSGCDGLIDQALAIQDPNDPAQMLPAFAQSDSLHPNDVGYQIIANAIDLSLFGAGSADAPLVPDGIYSITVRHSGGVIDDPGLSTASGTVMEQWTKDGGTNQHWTLKNLGNNVVSLINQASGLALEVPGGSMSQSAPVDQAPYTGAPGQQWNLIAVGNGWYEITNVASGQSLDVTAGSTAAGALLDQYPYHDVMWEQWTFVE